MKKVLTLFCFYILLAQPSIGQESNNTDRQPELFVKYQWLSNLIDYANCDDNSIDEYNLNGNTFLFVRIDQVCTLYDAIGTVYCRDSPTLSCLQTYGLTQLVDSWFCIPEDSRVLATVCPGEPLPTLPARYAIGADVVRPCGPAGLPGAPPTRCPCTRISSVNIEPKDGVISDLINGLSFDVRPERTTTYTITSTSGVSSPHGGCISETFTAKYTIIVKPISECIACDCDDNYMPVCGSDGKTYSNRCMAECAFVNVIQEGECSTDNVLPSAFDKYPYLYDLIDPNDCQGTSVQIYDNGSFAFVYLSVDGIGALYLDGKLHCRDTESYNCLSVYRLAAPSFVWKCSDSSNCICTEEYDPVCGADGKTYSNDCYATCAGVEIIATGECQIDCICTAEYRPVCGEDGKTYGNACEANCAGVAVESAGECGLSCDCDTDYSPVCGSDGKTYENACFAVCAGVEIIADGECNNGTNCTDENGVVFYENCDDGSLYYFIKTENGEILDPYFSTEFVPNDGQYLEFSYTLADFDSPCSIADRAVNITCYIAPDDVKPDCYKHFGNIVIRDCDDGRSFFFIESDDKLYDVYYADGISFDHADGMPVRFDFIPANFDSPCSFADSAISVTCIEEDIPDDSLLGLGQLVSSIIDPGSCESARILVFKTKDTYLVYIQSDGRGELYDIDGRFYCADGGAVSCLSSYELESPILDLTCEDLGIGNIGPIDTPFDVYPWLNDIIDQQDCENTSIDVYSSTAFAYLFVQVGDRGRLYFEDGQLFCTDSENYSCVDIYNLAQLTTRWECSDAHGGGNGDGNGSTFNEQIRTCPANSVTISIPKAGLFGDNSTIDPGCPPPPLSGEALPCSCSLVGEVTVSPEIGVIRFDPKEGILEVNPEGQQSYTVTIRTIPSNPEVNCNPNEYQSVYTIIPDSGLCEGLLGTETSFHQDFRSEPTLSISPNPSSDMIYVTGIPDSDGVLKIYNMVGQEIKTAITSQPEATIHVSQFKRGLYVLVWQSESVLSSLKFVVN